MLAVRLAFGLAALFPALGLWAQPASVARGGSLLDALTYAFEVDPASINGPDWLREAKVDLAVKTSGEDARSAFRDALIEKFSLEWRREARLVDVWVMKLLRLPGPDLAAADLSGGFRGGHGSMSGAGVTLSCNNCGWEWIVRYLRWSLDAPLIDETGLGGFYAINLSWRRDDPDGMIRAWREKLGIDLTRQSRTLDVLVIDSAAQPFETCPCQPASEIRDALRRLPAIDDSRIPLEQRIAAARSLVQRYPRDIFVHHRYQEVFRSRPGAEKEWERALKLYRSVPGDPLMRYLEARLLLRDKAERSRQTLTELLDQRPGFPWPHLALAEIAELPDTADKSTAGWHIRAFLKACPEAPEAYEHLGSLEGPQWMPLAAKVRALLASTTAANHVQLFPHLWELELRAYPKTLHGEIRKRVRQDLERLQGPLLRPSRDWYAAVAYAASILGDPGIQDWLEKTMIASRAQGK